MPTRSCTPKSLQNSDRHIGHRTAGKGPLHYVVLLVLLLIPILGQAQLANSSWPKYLGNPLNTSLGLGAGTSSTAKWTYAAQAPIYTSPAIGADGTIYFGSDDSNVYALNGSTGALKWSFPTMSYVESSPAIGKDGTVYIGGDDANVYAINGTTGTQKWAYTTGSFIDASPAIGPDGTVYIGSTDGNVYALNGSTGAVIWTYPTQGSVESSAAVGSDGTVYVGSDDGNLYAIVGSTGILKWSYNIGLAVYNSPTIGPDGTIFVGEDQIYAFGPASGNLLWSQTLSNEITGPISISASEILYVATADGNIQAVNGINGNVNWLYSGPAGLYEAAPIIGSDGTIYVASDGGIISALNGTNGSAIWTYTASSDQFGSTPAMGADGTLYIGALSGTLTAFAPLALSSVSLSPAIVASGETGTGTVTLNYPSPGNGVVVNLSSSSGFVMVPSTVSFATGSTTATFTYTTSSVGSNSTAKITASYQGNSVTANLQVQPTALIGISFSPNSVAGGTTATGTVTLNGPAPSGGILVNLSISSSTYAKVPAWVSVPAGLSSITFSVPTVSVTTGHSVTVTATFGKETQSTTLGIDPAILASISANPSNIPGGTISTGTVTITGPAPTGGVVVKLGSSLPSAATVGVSVTIPAKKTSATFIIRSLPVASQVTSTITGSIGTSSQSVAVNVLPAALLSVTVAPQTVVGGVSTTGKVTLTGPAPKAGVKVLLSVGSGPASVPVSVTVVSGQTAATFLVKTLPVAANSKVTINGSYASVTETASLTVSAPTLTAFTLAPSTVASGKLSTATIRISSAAPAGGLVINLSSANSNASVPATLTIAVGKTSGTFTVTAAAVKAKTTVTLSAGLNGAAKTAVLTIL